MYANYVRRFPVYFLPGGGKCLKRPVKSVDLVKGIALAGLSENAVGKTYALAGEGILSMAEMAKAVLKLAGKRHWMIPVPWWIAKKLAVLKSWIGGKPVTAEQALAGFLYDAAPDIENARADLGYNPGSPLEI
jgi:NADH dehydrogenase